MYNRIKFPFLKDIATPFLTVLMLSSCDPKLPIDHRRIVISKFISAAENLDTAQLYKLVDTSSNFKIHTKQTFLDQISYVKSHLQACGDGIMYSSIKIKDVTPYFADYIVPFCRGKNGEIMDGSFEMYFTFSNYDNDNSIRYFDIKIHRTRITPTIAPPVQKQ